jgi:hypothetical protein
MSTGGFGGRLSILYLLAAAANSRGAKIKPAIVFDVRSKRQILFIDCLRHESSAST